MTPARSSRCRQAESVSSQTPEDCSLSFSFLEVTEAPGRVRGGGHASTEKDQGRTPPAGGPEGARRRNDRGRTTLKTAAHGHDRRSPQVEGGGGGGDGHAQATDITSVRMWREKINYRANGKAKHRRARMSGGRGRSCVSKSGSGSGARLRNGNYGRIPRHYSPS